MKKLLLLWALAAATLTQAAPTPADSAALYQAYLDSMHATLHYQTGRVQLGVATLTVPNGFRFLDSAQSRRVLTQFWGNPNGESLGMLFPAGKQPLDDNSWAFVVEYEPMGYVKDDDAEDIDYDELLTDMQTDTEEGNAERTAAGYEPVKLVGWAAAPFYDKNLNVLHWAKELQFGGAERHTLNYNVRLLGRKGVLNLNAVGGMDQLAGVRGTIPAVIKSVSFSKGLQYAAFDPDLDEVAAYGLGGLVAGKVLAKVGAFALLAKFWKVILAAGAAGVAGLRRLFGGGAASSDNQA